MPRPDTDPLDSGLFDTEAGIFRGYLVEQAIKWLTTPKNSLQFATS